MGVALISKSSWNKSARRAYTLAEVEKTSTCVCVLCKRRRRRERGRGSVLFVPRDSPRRGSSYFRSDRRATRVSEKHPDRMGCGHTGREEPPRLVRRDGFIARVVRIDRAKFIHRVIPFIRFQRTYPPGRNDPSESASTFYNDSIIVTVVNTPV